MIKIIKEKDQIVRDSVQRKMCVVVFGDKEKNLPNRAARKRSEMKRAKEIIVVVEGKEAVDQQIEEVFRIGKYQEGGQQLMETRSSTQSAAESVHTKANWEISKSRKDEENMDKKRQERRGEHRNK